MKLPKMSSVPMALTAAALTAGAAALPAWGDSDESQVERAPRPAPAPPAGVVLPAPPGAVQKQGVERGRLAPPLAPEELLPLSDERIEAARRRLERFAACMTRLGQDVGDPEVGPDRVAIPLGTSPFSRDFRRAERECGGPPPPVG